MPFFLILASGAIAYPLLKNYQRFMKDKNSRGRYFEHQIHSAEMGIERAKEEEAKIRILIEAAKSELMALEKQRNELENTLLKVKMDIGSAEENEGISGMSGMPAPIA